MLLVNCIRTNIVDVAVRKITKGLLEYIFIWIIKYLTTIRLLYDIVPRAVKANIRENMPTARTNKEYYEYGRIRFLAVIASYCNDAFAIAREKSSSAVFNILLCKILECEVNYAK